MRHRHPRTRALRHEKRHHRARTTARALKATQALKTAHKAILAVYKLALTLHGATTQPWWPGN